MKKLYTFLIALFLSGIVSGQWVQQNSNEDAILFDVMFLDENNGWTVGEDGYYTVNGGTNWEPMLMFFEQRSVWFIDENYGWGCGNMGKILHTIDGGANLNSWSLQESGTETNLYSLVFFDSLTGITTGGSVGPWGYHHILKTTNGGENWYMVDGGDYALYNLDFFDSSKGWGVGEVVYHTEDAGESWMQICDIIYSNSDVMAYSVSFIDSLNGWIAGYYYVGYENIGIVLNTVDGGYNWEHQISNLPVLNDIKFINLSEGWAVGNEGTILHSTDGGQNWEFQESGTLADLQSVCFINQNMGWICGDSGVILHTNNGGIVGLVDPMNETIDFKIYPNPTHSSITIELPIQPPQNTNLTISSTNGQLLITLPITEPQTEIDISHLPNGIYIVKVWDDKEVMVQKVVKQ